MFFPWVMALAAGWTMCPACADALQATGLPKELQAALSQHLPPLVSVENDSLRLLLPDVAGAADLRHQVRVHLDYVDEALGAGRRIPRDTRVVVISHPPTWASCQKLFEAQERTQAAFAHGWIFLLRADEVSELSDLAHELVHLRLRQRYGKGMPLWLEEGLSLHLGMLAASDYYRFQGHRVLPRKDPPVLEWKSSGQQLDTFKRYPDDPVLIRSFYEQSRLAVAWLWENLPAHERTPMIDKSLQGGDVMTMLRSIPELSETDLALFRSLMTLRRWEEKAP